MVARENEVISYPIHHPRPFPFLVDIQSISLIDVDGKTG